MPISLCAQALCCVLSELDSRHAHVSAGLISPCWSARVHQRCTQVHASGPSWVCLGVHWSWIVPHFVLCWQYFLHRSLASCFLCLVSCFHVLGHVFLGTLFGVAPWCWARCTGFISRCMHERGVGLSGSALWCALVFHLCACVLLSFGIHSL